jgi:aspartate 1-decarboxylase
MDLHCVRETYGITRELQLLSHLVQGLILGRPTTRMSHLLMSMREMLLAKIHGGSVTGCDLHYEGSCGIGPDLLKESGLLPFEKVSVLNVSTGSRLETYVIRGKKNGELSLNGAAARHAATGDKIIILAFTQIPANEVAAHRARIVILDKHNKVKSSQTKSTKL